MSCLVLSACAEAYKAETIPLPPERLDCVTLEAGRPTINPEHVIDWSAVSSIADARSEAALLIKSVRERELTVAHYVLALESQLFLCADDARWLRETEAAILAK